VDAKQGNILVAQPFLNDGWFKRSVILLTEHNENGTMGFVMNRFANLMLKDVIPTLSDLKYPLYYGGPVSQNQLFYIHNFGHEVANSFPISDKYSWGGDFNDIVKIINDKAPTGDQIKFFIGYSGWEAGQLDKELGENAWFVNKSDYKNMMLKNFGDIWGNELKRLGTNLSVLANFPEDPSLN